MESDIAMHLPHVIALLYHHLASLLWPFFYKIFLFFLCEIKYFELILVFDLSTPTCWQRVPSLLNPKKSFAAWFLLFSLIFFWSAIPCLSTVYYFDVSRPYPNHTVTRRIQFMLCYLTRWYEFIFILCGVILFYVQEYISSTAPFMTPESYDIDFCLYMRYESVKFWSMYFEQPLVGIF